MNSFESEWKEYAHSRYSEDISFLPNQKTKERYAYWQALWTAKKDSPNIEYFESCLEAMHADDLGALLAAVVLDSNECTLLCEREIACRGLHVDNPKERFEL